MLSAIRFDGGEWWSLAGVVIGLLLLYGFVRVVSPRMSRRHDAEAMWIALAVVALFAIIGLLYTSWSHGETVQAYGDLRQQGIPVVRVDAEVLGADDATVGSKRCHFEMPIKDTDDVYRVVFRKGENFIALTEQQVNQIVGTVCGPS